MTDIVAADDLFHHQGNDDPWWNESLCFSWCVPEEVINGFVYGWHRPNMGLSCGGPAVWDPSGEHTWDCLFYDWNWLQPLPPSAEATTFELSNTFSVRSVDPLQRYEFGYDRDGCRVELTWWAAMAPHQVRIVGGMVPAGTCHYEQHGRMTGYVDLDGRRFEVDCWSMHDRTWGPRHIRNLPRGDYFWAVADERTGFFAIALDDGTIDRVIGGYLLRDGILGDLVAGERRVVERGRDFRPIRIEVTAEDSLGRTLEAEGQCLNWLAWPGYPDLFEWWSLAEWQFDGLVGFGEEQDFFPPRTARRLIRAGRTEPLELTL